MKQILRLGDCYVLCRYRLKQLKMPFFSLLAAATTMCLYAQARQQETPTVTGKVISAASGRAIEGATVMNKRTRVRTVTDRLGDYRIAARPDDILRYSFVGYVTAEEEVRGRERITVALDSADSMLEEVEVNAGYYTVKDRERTGSIARVTAKDIEKQPVLNPLEALKGRMAGVEIVQLTGEIGGGFTIRVRGQNSLRTTLGVNDPLFLVDGVPITSVSQQRMGNALLNAHPLNAINQADIESIEVLKDADATAIYGSRGANGVVLITTKRSKAAEERLVLDFQAGAGKVRKFMELLDTEQYLEMRREAFANNPAATPSGDMARDLLRYDQERYTDWQRELLGGTSGTTRSGFSLRGGMDAIRYQIGGSYLTQSNVYPGDFGYIRGGGHISINQGLPTSRFQSQLQLTGSSDRNELPSIVTNLVESALILAPNAPSLLDEEGNLNWEEGAYMENPLAILKQHYVYRQFNTTLNYAFRYQFLPGIRVAAVVGYNRASIAERLLEPSSSRNPRYSTAATHRVSQHASDTWNVEPQLTASKAFGKHKIDLLFGGTILLRDGNGQSLYGAGFPNDALINNIALAQTLSASNYTADAYRYTAVFFRGNYGHKSRYFLNLTARRDGSSRFGPGKRWGNFGAVGVAWLFAEEPTVKAMLPWLSLGKLRTSYGVAGSDQIPDYGYMATYNILAASDYGVPILTPARLANADYRWESNRKLEFALEWGVLGNRVGGTLAWYRNRSGNQLVGYPLPAVSGFTSVQYNLPATVQNTGVEVELHAIPLRSKVFHWQIAANLTFPERTLLAYPNIEASSYSTTYQVGESMNRGLVYVYDGLDTETGLYMIRDVDGNGAINLDDRVWRDYHRAIYGGVNNTVSYRGVEVSAFFQVDKRERTYNQSFSLPGRYMENQPVGVMRRWRQPGDKTDVQQFWTGSGAPATAYSRLANSAAWRHDDFFVRLSNLSVAWTVPAAWCNRISAKGIRLSLQGQNLWVSDRKNRFDPETTFNYLPPLRIWTGGIQLTL